MKNLSEFLQKFKIIKDPALDKFFIIDAVRSECGISLEPSHIQFRGNTILVSAHAAIKSSIYMKKSPLLEAISRMLPERLFSDIR